MTSDAASRSSSPIEVNSRAVAARSVGDVRVVVGDVRATPDEPGDDVGRRRVAGVPDVRLERHADDPDLRPRTARPRSFSASATRSTT